MKKSFMTRVLAVSLSTAMAFSVPVVGNFTTAFADTAASSSAALAMSYTQKDAEVGTRMVFSLKGSQASKWKVLRASSSDKAVAAIAKTTSKKVAVEAQGAGEAKVFVRVQKTKDKREKVLKIRLNITAADPTIASVEQTDAAKLVVTLSKPVESVAAADFAIAKNDEAKTAVAVKSATLDETDKTKVTLETETDMTDGLVYTVTYTAATEDKTVSTAEFTAKTVEKAVLTEVKLTAANGFKATFSADASKDITKESFTVKSADGKFIPTVKSVTFAADGLTADVVLDSQMYSGNTYNVTVGDVTKDMAVVFGDVADAEITTTTAEKNKETKIEFKLYDAQGVDVTPTIKVDDYVKIDGADGYEFENTYASNTKIVMTNVNDVATVKLTYDPLKGGDGKVETTGTITCVAPTAVVSGKQFFTLQTVGDTDTPNFYLKSFAPNTTLYADEEQNEKVAYFTALDENGKAISYDSYTLSSSNENVMLVTEDRVSGKYASATVTPVARGTAQVIIKATKDGLTTTYTGTVTVKPRRVPTRIKLANASLSLGCNETRTVLVQVLDQDGSPMPDVEVTFDQPSSQMDIARVKEASVKSNNTMTVTAGALAGTNKTTITAVADGETTTLRASLDVTVKNATGSDDYKLVLTKKVDMNPGIVGDKVVDISVVHYKGGTYFEELGKSSIASIQVKKGTNYYSGNSIYDLDNKVSTPVTMEAIDKHTTLELVTKGSIMLTADTKLLQAVSKGSIDISEFTGANPIAETGTYEVTVKVKTEAGKEITLTDRFVVTNSMEMPTLTYDKTSTDRLNLLDGVRDCISASVDLIQDDDVSIIGAIGYYNNDYTSVFDNIYGTKSIRYAVVADKFNGNTYYYFVPMARSITFK